MWNVWLAEGPKALSSLPLMLLQYTAVLGILSMVLIVYRASQPSVARAQTVYGVVIGVTGYLLTLLVAEFIQSPSKPYVRNDLLFLACLLGGWRGGGICFALVLLARIQFGGLGHMAAAVVDMFLVCGGGMAAHGLVRRQPILELKWPRLALVWLLRVAVGLLAVAVIAALGLAPASVNHSLAALRTFAALPALALLAGLYAILRIDAQHRELQRRERQRGYLHPLTGLRNRRALLEHLDALFGQHPAQPHALVLIETSNYVEMLLAHGHAWADRAWRDLAAALDGPPMARALLAFRPQVFQFADTTLAVVLHGVSTPDVERLGVATRLHHGLNRTLVNQPNQGPMPQLRLNVVGASFARHRTAAQALRDAGLLLQHQVDPGEAVHVFHQTFERQAVLETELLTRLMRWIDTDSPPLAYQPKCRLSTREVEGAEALLRPGDIGAARVSPLQVLSMASRHQLLSAFEWCTVKAVVRDAQRCWRQAPGVSLSVNISGASLSTHGFAQRVHEQLLGARIPMTSITLELTESSPLPDVETVKANLQHLHACGIPLSLDDFGSGYSGLTVLAQHPFAEVKIDSHMVAMMDVPRMRSAIQLALETARRYDAKFVAEGVETQAQCDTLAGMGIDVGQGFLFAPALRIDELLGLASHSRRGDAPPLARAD